MKKRKFSLLFLFLATSFKMVMAQNSLTGCYGRKDSQITLNSDSTFFFFYAVDTYRGWLKGTWRLKRKKIVLIPRFIYDTITVKIDGKPMDSLVLSRDYNSERISLAENKRFFMFNYEQSVTHCPKLLKWKKEILYKIENNKMQIQKIKNGYYIEPFDPWYTKNLCK